MSYALIPLPERLSLLALLAMSACGGEIGDDTSRAQGAGGVSTSDAGGTKPAYPTGFSGSYVISGGAPGAGGSRVQPFGGTGMSGSVSLPASGAPTVTGGARALGGSFAAAGRVSVPGGTAPTSIGGTAGGAWASGGIVASSGKASTGGSQSVGGSISSTSPSTGGATASGDVCILPPSPGECDGYVQAYYFDPFRGRCEPFIYGGCGGNANRFDTLQACEQHCTQSVCPLIIPPTSPIWTCPASAACYYEITTGCRCRAEDGECSTDSTCALQDDAGADASSEAPDAGSSTAPLPVVLCTCGSSQWGCRVIELLTQ
jgi:hypothetical protein